MKEAVPARLPGRWLEYLLALAILVLLGRAMWWVYAYGQLPQPFFYDPTDTFMDWFNTAYWARDTGPYDSWGALYPPLSFVVLRLLGDSACYADGAGLETRACDWIGLVAIHAIYLLNLVLIAKTYLKIDRRTALPRAIALSAGLPMLFALERGNLLLLCFTCMLLSFGPLLKSARLRWLFAGLAVNFKVYLIGAVLAPIIRRRWLWAEGALLATIGVYLVTYGILGAGTPFEIYDNIVSYAQGSVSPQVTDIWYSVTYLPLISLLQGQNFPITNLIGSQLVETGLVLLPILIRTGQAAVLLAVVASWLRPEMVPPFRLAFFGTVLALISSEAGGYTQILAILFVFMERWRGIARPLAILCSYILCLPGDIALTPLPPLFGDSYLTNQPVEIHIDVGLGMFLRPGLLIIIAIALSAATIHDVWADIRVQGWKHR
ncbi:hypothetical protein [Novosphingobium sp.]|uniref:hypothetical protein n=1 Tax=Novosphingobium sp. TaxID=1874826 RepID=UPI00352B8368